MSVLTPTLQVLKTAVIQRVRELPVTGELLVRSGDEVDSSDIVGKASLAGDLYILRLTDKMGLEAFEVMGGLKVAVGDEVKRGDLLCEHSGLFGLLRTKFNSPDTGTIEFITERTGHIGLRLPPHEIELRAHLTGRVVEIEDGKSVTVESRGSFIQGIFGVGGERRGYIKLLSIESDQQVSVDDIPEDCKGAVLVGGTNPTYEALQRASELGAVGFITGAIDDKALAQYLGYDLGIALTGDEEVEMTVIVTEGFGDIPISERVMDIVSDCDRFQVSINGATQVRAGAIRPEIVIFRQSNDDSDNLVKEGGVLQVGSTIRLIRVPYFGEKAEIVELPTQAEKIATGAETRVLRAKLVSTGEVVTVPRANVEIV